MTTTTHPSGLRDAVQLWAVAKTYGSGEQAVAALDRVTLAFPRGSFTAIMGPSGSGKSTLLQCAAGLDRPGDGQVLIGETELSRLTEKQLTLLRRERIGFVFQAFNLMTALTAAQNVALPLRLAGRRIEPGRVEAALDAVGLRDRAGHRPGELSGGQQQRVAIARALVADPEVIFADEPTGALDTNTSREVLGLLRRVVDAHRQTVIMVTHDPVAAAYADRVVYLADGRIADEYLADRRDHGERAQVIAARMAHLEAAPPAPAAAPVRVKGAW
ncbi:ABC transporter ATP-binding protein [Actinorhabdospora filicis]|uniref:ABC transporter ATP-binding protein n=1 Tax=Actinorhabdospora filicis TaxID=1785913 RepID=A0A9W6W9M8_9ACTN|nr:ABC transporter ATP-binding protein [Actinorhabdospora filicis]GLZ77706.1 ABC transporter ATP-binding protein [Actinorhabdospora filicis]